MALDINKQELVELISTVVKETITQLGIAGSVGNCGNTKPNANEKTAYQKTEQLLYNYRGFKRIINERMEEIETIRMYGIPKRSGSIVEYSPHSGSVQGLVLEEESVENAIANVQASVQGTVQAIALIDKCMAQLRNDPYYAILEMRYFDGRTQEDIALEFGCSQVTISNNKNRLVRELSMRLFPNQAINEMLK